MADALPFVQVNIPKGGETPGTGAGARSENGEMAEPGLFDSIVAEFASTQEPGDQLSPETPVQLMPLVETAEQEQDVPLHPPLLLAESALEIVVSMKDSVTEDISSSATGQDSGFVPLEKGGPDVVADTAEEMLQPIPDPVVDNEAVNTETVNIEAVDALLKKMETLMDKGLLSQEVGEKLVSLLSKLKTAKPEELPSLREEIFQTVEELSQVLEPDVAEDLKQQLAVLFSSQPEREKTDSAPSDVREKAVKPASGKKISASQEKPEETEPDDALSAAAGIAMPQAEAVDTLQPDNDSQEEGAVSEAALESAQTGKPHLPEGEKDQSPREVRLQRQMSQPDEEAAVAAAAASQPRVQEAAPRESVAPQREEAPAQSSVARPVGEERQPDTSRGNDGNAGDAGSQNSRGQQTAQTGIRRSAGNASVAGEDAANRRENQEITRGHSFQSFFEGVLSSRRTGASPAPMSLAPNTPDAAYAPRAEVLRDGLVNVVRFVRADGVRRANVIVDPPALGRISVELTTSTSGVEASIRVSSEQVRQLVQDQISQLRITLEQQGVQVTQFAVDVQQDNGERQQGQGQPGQDGGRRRRGRVGTREEPEEAGDEFRIDLEEGMLHWVA
ncbi:MAG: flagellar hook-length control protein FliK [Fretibacterium sp.]|nr:flagellar hook-length control protein FliK [Fretibacterium sp.]